MGVAPGKKPKLEEGPKTSAEWWPIRPFWKKGLTWNWLIGKKGEACSQSWPRGKEFWVRNKNLLPRNLRKFFGKKGC